jgi:hypothetical protein
MKSFRFAGITLIATSLGFVAVFSYLAAHFGYPEVLEGPAADVLPALVAGGIRMRAVWSVYAVLPAGVVLAAILAYPLFRKRGETISRLGVIAAFTSATSMTAGLMRWPTINYALGRRFVEAGADERQILASIFEAGNLYLGTLTGEFIGEVTLSLWFLTSSVAILRGLEIWRWTGYLGVFTAASMSVGAFRNVSSWVAPMAALNNNLLPIWLIVLGAALIAPKGTKSGQPPRMPTGVADLTRA